MAVVFCKNCGGNAPSVIILTNRTCSKHPNGQNKGKCELYEGSIKSQYTCKYCGSKAPTIIMMTNRTCNRHPIGQNKGKCSPAL